MEVLYLNPEYKTAFLRSCIENKSETFTPDELVILVPQYFRFIEPYEELWGSDVAEQNHKTLNKLIDNLINVVDTSLCASLYNESDLELSIAKTIYLYAKWCSKNKVFKTNVHGMRRLLEVRTAINAIYSPDHLKEILDMGLDPADNETSDCIGRALFWLFYYGLTPSEVLPLTKSDWDKNSKTVHFERNGVSSSIQVPDDAARALTVLSENDYFVFWHPLYGSSKRARAGGSSLFRRAVKSSQEHEGEGKIDTLGLSRLMLAWYRKNPNSERTLSIQSVFENGAYYRAAKEEKSQSKILKRRDQVVVGEDGTMYPNTGLFELDRLIILDEHGELSTNKQRGTKSTSKFALKQMRSNVIKKYSFWKKFSGNEQQGDALLIRSSSMIILYLFRYFGIPYYYTEIKTGV